MWFIGIPLFALLVLFAAGCVVAARHVFSLWPSLDARRRRHFVILFPSLAVFLAGAMNFVAFFTVSVAIGGDALSGKLENGRYYVSSHGRLTEVSPEVWEYSRVHAGVTWVTSVLAVLGLAIAVLSSSAFGRHTPNILTISVTREGAILVDGEKTTAEEAAGRAEAARALRMGVTLRRDYPPEAPPPEAVRLCQELVGRHVPFRTADGPA
jgi:hypothetical protein